MNKILSHAENVLKKCLRADYLSNKLPANLRGLVTDAESSHWLAWTDGPSTKQN